MHHPVLWRYWRYKKRAKGEGVEMSRTKLVVMVAVLAVGAGSVAFAAPQQPDQQQPNQQQQPSPGPGIVGGRPVPDSSSKSYPWIAALLNKTTPGSALDQQMCAGSLIDSNSVLTAAHCLKNIKKPSDLRIVLGETQLSGNTGVIRQATRLDIHDLYKSGEFKYDVAVITLHTTINITPVRLPLSTENYYEQPGKVMTVAGWGATTSGGTHTAQTQEAKVTVVSDADGATAYPGLYMPSIMIAAGGNGKGTCIDDSGGPLFTSVISKLGKAKVSPVTSPQASAKVSGDSHYQMAGENHYQYGITSFARLKDGQLVCDVDPAGYTEVNATSIRTFITTAMNQ
jgi:trypsin